MSTLTVNNPDLDLSITLDQPSIEVVVGQPVISVTVDNPDLGLSVSVSDPPIIEAVVENPQILISAIGGQIQGPQGERGATFLGGYPSLINLPAIDGVNVKDGDFSLVRDTSTIFQVRP